MQHNTTFWARLDKIELGLKGINQMAAGRAYGKANDKSFFGKQITIIAREYSIPAVANLPGVIKTLLTVEGDLGKVYHA